MRNENKPGGRNTSPDPRSGQDAKDVERARQRLEVLLGERGEAKRPMSAIRRGELVQLAATGLKSSQVTAAPTMEQHNALQADVKTIFEALALISNRLGNATLPTG